MKEITALRCNSISVALFPLIVLCGCVAGDSHSYLAPDGGDVTDPSNPEDPGDANPGETVPGDADIERELTFDDIVNMNMPLVAFSDVSAYGLYRIYDLGYYRSGHETLIEGIPMRSFFLKKGHMLTIGVTEGYRSASDFPSIFHKHPVIDEVWTFVASNVYIANTEDLLVNLGPDFAGKVNWIRVGTFDVPTKRGMCTSGWNESEREAILSADPNATRGGWWYYWGLYHEPGTDDAAFVPMFARGKDEKLVENSMWRNMLQTDLSPSSKYLRVSHMLGFNEPDIPNRERLNALSLDQVVGGWPLLMNTGIRLGAPAPIQGGVYEDDPRFDNVAHHMHFLHEFLKRIGTEEERGRVDFIPVHWYDYRNNEHPTHRELTAEHAAKRFEDYLTYVWETYQLPIWVTEFHLDWTENHTNDVKINRDFIKLARKFLEETPWVERYSWYEHGPVPQSHYWIDGSMTDFGKQYSGRDSDDPEALHSNPSFSKAYDLGHDKDSSRFEF